MLTLLDLLLTPDRVTQASSCLCDKGSLLGKTLYMVYSPCFSSLGTSWAKQNIDHTGACELVLPWPPPVSVARVLFSGRPFRWSTALVPAHLEHCGQKETLTTQVLVNWPYTVSVVTLASFFFAQMFHVS